MASNPIGDCGGRCPWRARPIELHDEVNSPKNHPSGGYSGGVAVCAIDEMARGAPDMDFTVARARAMLDDLVRDGRLAARRHGGGGESS